MREIAIVSFAQSNRASEPDRNEVEILMPVVAEAVKASGLERTEIDFTCSGSSDFLQGQPFAFVMALDAVGAWPPIKESHVEQDGAWALYEAWVKIQTGEVDSALVYSFGKSAAGDLAEVQSLANDPYCVAPLWLDADSAAALQARAYLEKTGRTERDLAEVAVRCARAAADNPNAVRRGSESVDELLRRPYVASPLRAHDCAPACDGATAMILVADERAKELVRRPVWIRGFDHRVDPPALGVRALTRSRSTEMAAGRARVGDDKVDFAEIYAPYTHSELILKEALGLADEVPINLSGGALGAHTMMSCGLNRIGDAASRLMSGEGDRAVAHATHGPALQQNLVCVLEGE